MGRPLVLRLKAGGTSISKFHSDFYLRSAGYFYHTPDPQLAEEIEKPIAARSVYRLCAIVLVPIFEVSRSERAPEIFHLTRSFAVWLVGLVQFQPGAPAGFPFLRTQAEGLCLPPDRLVKSAGFGKSRR
jgi:hypothetical protein